MGFKVTGATGTDLEVEVASKAGRVLLYDAAGNAMVKADKAAVALANQSGAMVGGYGLHRDVARLLRMGDLGSIHLARPSQLLFQDPVDGAAVNTQMWTQTQTTMTAVQAARSVTLNANATLTTTTTAHHVSLRRFSVIRGAALRFSSRTRLNWQANGAIIDMGFGVPSGTTAALTDTVSLQVAADGTVQVMVTFNGSGFTTTLGSFASLLNATTIYNIDIYVTTDAVRVVVSSMGTVAIDAEVDLAVAHVFLWNAPSMSVFFRVLNTTAVTTASQVIYNDVQVSYEDQESVKPWAEQLAGMGRGTVLNPASGVQLANYANSAAPASAALSNTAAGYTTLGGQWQFVAVAGAETDYALFAFTVPTGRSLYVMRVRIDAFNMGAVVAGTPTLLQWGIGRAAAVTLASNSFRQVLGSMYFPVGAAIGQDADRSIDWLAPTPFVVDSAQIFHLILKVPVGTATALQVIRGTATINGYLE